MKKRQHYLISFHHGGANPPFFIYPILVFLTLCFPFWEEPVFAQHFKAGVLAGIVTSQVDGDTYAGYSKAGICAGGYVTRKFSAGSNWSASFEIMYIQKGSRKVPHPDKGDFADYKLKLNYLEVPILLKYDFTNLQVQDTSGEKKIPFSVVGGIAFATLIHAEEWDAFGPVTGGTPFQKVDIPVILGLSYSFSEHIGVDIKTAYSILPVRKGGTSAYYQNWTYRFFKPGYYNNLIVFSLRYQF